MKVDRLGTCGHVVHADTKLDHGRFCVGTESVVRRVGDNVLTNIDIKRVLLSKGVGSLSRGKEGKCLWAVGSRSEAVFHENLSGQILVDGINGSSVRILEHKLGIDVIGIKHDGGVVRSVQRDAPAEHLICRCEQRKGSNCCGQSKDTSREHHLAEII